MGLTDWVSGGGQYEEDPVRRAQYTHERDKRRESVAGAAALDDQSRANQDRMAQIYGDRIEGKSPSVAYEQMQAQNAENKQQQLAMARSGGGGALGQAGAMRMAQQTAAQQDATLNRNAGLVRVQEQANAEAGLADLYNTQRAGDQARMGAYMGYEGQHDTAYNQAKAAEMQNYEQYADRRRQGAGGLMTMGASALAAGVGFSDKTVKEDIRPTSDDDLEDFLEAAKTYWYRYKEGSVADDGGRLHIGPMAQDLAKSKVGQTMVEETPSGKLGVDIDGAYGAFLAGLGQVSERLDALEGKKGRK